jgi:uncharacterized protein (TIGR02099 family)
MPRILHYCWLSIWYTFAIFMVLLATLYSIARISLPQIGQYNSEIESYVTGLLEQPVKIQSLDAEWHGIGPSLILNNVRILDNQKIAALVSFSKVSLGFGIIESLKLGQVSFNEISLTGGNLSAVRTKGGQLLLKGFEHDFQKANEVEDNRKLINWLLGQGKVNLNFDNLLYDDELEGGRNYHFVDTGVEFKNHGGRYLIDAKINMPGGALNKLKVSLDVEGDLLQIEKLSGKLFVSGEKIKLTNIIDDLKYSNWGLKMGASDFSLWADFENSKIKKLEGEVALENVEVTYTSSEILKKKTDPVDQKNSEKKDSTQRNTRTIKYPYLGGQFRWKNSDPGWRVSLRNFIINSAGRYWPSTELSIDYKYKDNKQTIISSSYLSVKDLAEFVKIGVIKNTDVLNAIERLQPKGEFHDFHLQLDGDDSFQYQLTTHLYNVGISPWKAAPGLRGISGELVMDEKQGSFSLLTKTANLNWPTQFQDRLAIGAMNGDVYWYNEQGNWHVDSKKITLSNNDIDLQAQIGLSIPGNGEDSAKIALMVNFQNVKANRVSTYLPIKVLSKKTIAWLDTALVSGKVPNGIFVLRGDLKDFPYDSGKGEFDVRFNVENGVLNYAQDWPLLREIDMEVVASGRGMKINASRATIFESELSDTRVEINDFDRTPIVLKISGNVIGATQEKLTYLQSSPPLNKIYGPFVEELKVKGDSKLHLDIDLLIDNDVQADITGAVDFNKNSLEVTSLGSVITNLNGTLNILPEGLDGSDLSGDLFGQSSTFRVKTVANKITSSKKDGIERNILVSSKGQFSASELSARYFPVMTDLVDGNSVWDLLLDIPLTINNQSNAEHGDLLKLSIKTNLRGTSIRLPMPVYKIKESDLDMEIFMSLKPDNRWLFQSNYGGRFNSINEIKYVSGESFKRGQIRFGDGPMVLPKGQGLRLVGQLDSFDVGIWRTFANQLKEKGSESKNIGKEKQSEPEQRESIANLLHSADLKVKNFKIFGQVATNLQLKLTKNDETLLANLSSKQIAGEIILPNDLDRNPIEMNLDHWHLTSSGGGGETIDPRNLPAIRAVCKSVTYKNRKFGSVKLITTKLADGLRLEHLELRPRSTTVNGQGTWVVNAGEQKSHYQFTLESENLGETLEDLDYLGNIRGGIGKVEASFSWPGALTDLDIAHLQGEVKLKFENGQLIEVNAGGAGRRILGLLSLQTLPRRLTLDFSDLFNDGLSFNLISGDFKIDDGDAYTTNLVMDGPGVSAHTRGHIDLLNQNYDQIAMVKPHVSDFASFIALVASAGPWAIFVPQLLKGGLDPIFKYTITGKWDNPKVEPIIEAIVEEEEDP